MIRKLLVILTFTAVAAFAQSAPPPPQGDGAPPDAPQMRRPWPGMRGGMDGMRGRHGMHGMRGGKWWKNPELAQQVGLSDQQVTQIDKIFQDHRVQLIDLKAALEKEEVAMEPLIEADQPNEAQVTAQIDRIAAARARLEKSHATMLLGIRRVLTAEQWKKLQALHHGPGFAGRPQGPMGAPRGGPGPGPGAPPKPPLLEDDAGL